jgi:hypothetical protein
MIMLYSSESILFPICIVSRGIVMHFKVGPLVSKNLGKVALHLSTLIEISNLSAIDNLWFSLGTPFSSLNKLTATI